MRRRPAIFFVIAFLVSMLGASACGGQEAQEQQPAQEEAGGDVDELEAVLGNLSEEEKRQLEEALEKMSEQDARQLEAAQEEAQQQKSGERP